MKIKKMNADEMEWEESTEGNFSYFRKHLSRKAGGQMLGVSMYKLLPNKKAFPFHFHYSNEEAIFVLNGNGTLRLNKEKLQIKSNDYIPLPRGSQYAHQVINTSDEPLIYLCLSTMIEPDVLQYPDSGKIGIMVGSAPGGEKTQYSFKAFYQKNNDVPYHEGEE